MSIFQESPEKLEREARALMVRFAQFYGDAEGMRLWSAMWPARRGRPPGTAAPATVSLLDLYDRIERSDIGREMGPSRLSRQLAHSLHSDEPGGYGLSEDAIYRKILKMRRKREAERAEVSMAIALSEKSGATPFG